MTGIRSTDDSLIVDKRPGNGPGPKPTSRAYTLTRPRLLSSSQVAVTRRRVHNNAAASTNIADAYLEQRRRASKAR